jgi:DNA adenine methylase
MPNSCCALRMTLTTNEPWSSPVFRWAGSKRKLLPRLLSAVPENYERYIEPFAGSACLFFALRPKRAILGDINSELVHAYDVIRRHPRLVARLAMGQRTDSRTYYRLRRTAPASLSEIERAARFVYLNRHSFNGVYRVNRAGYFNVPRGTRTGRLPSEAHFYRCSIALRCADLRAADYQQCLRNIKCNDFVYLDPPYASRRRNRYGEYGYNCFAEHQLPTLLKVLRRIADIGATFLLSYCFHREFTELPADWHRTLVRVRRHVAGFADHRRVVREMLISNRPLVSSRGVRE